MVRTIVCASLALLLCAGIGLGADKAKGKKKGQVRGKVEKIDTATSTLTVTIKKKQETSEKEIALTEETRVVTFTGDQKNEKVGKSAFGEIKKGDRVLVRLDANGAATEITVNPPHAKKKPAK